jgi:hypothetical protein
MEGLFMERVRARLTHGNPEQERTEEDRHAAAVARRGGGPAPAVGGPADDSHDFGARLAGQGRTHTVAICSTSGVRWTFAKIMTTRAGSVSKVSALGGKKAV